MSRRHFGGDTYRLNANARFVQSEDMARNSVVKFSRRQSRRHGAANAGMKRNCLVGPEGLEFCVRLTKSMTYETFCNHVTGRKMGRGYSLLASNSVAIAIKSVYIFADNLDRPSDISRAIT